MKKIVAVLLLITSTFCGLCQTTTTWKETKVYPPQPARAGNLSIAVDPATDDIYVGTIRSGIFRSKDKGHSWEHVMETGVMIGKIVITPEHMFATGVAAVYRSDDGGDTWTDFPVPTDHTVSGLVVLSNGDVVISTADIENTTDSTANYRGDGIFISRDHGATWTNSSTGLNATKAVTNLAVDSKDHLYAGTSYYFDHEGYDPGTGIYYSSNQGVSWSRFDPLYFQSGPHREYIRRIYTVTAIEVDQSDSIYFAFDGAGPNYQMSGNFKNSHDGAVNQTSWAGMKLKNESSDWSFTPMNSFFRSASGDLYASIHAPISRSVGGPYVKVNGQAQWKRSISGMTAPVVGDEFGYRQCAFAETSAGEVFAVQHNDPKVYVAQKHTTTGIDEIEKIGLTVFPNPASDKLKIEVAGREPVQATLLSTDGKKIVHQTVSGNDMIDVSGVSAGLYLLTITTNTGQQITHKLSIVH